MEMSATFGEPQAAHSGVNANGNITLKVKALTKSRGKNKTF